MIKINIDKLNNDVQNVMNVVTTAAAAINQINTTEIYSDLYKKDQAEKAADRYTAALKSTLDGMRSKIAADVKAAKVKQQIDYNERTYYATIVKQEIEGLNTAQLRARYDDILKEENESKKKEFERLAVAMMKNSGDDPAALMFKQKIYENMTPAEQDDVDTAQASEAFLYNVDIIERQANALLYSALGGARDADPSALMTIWNEGRANAERNVAHAAKLV